MEGLDIYSPDKTFKNNGHSLLIANLRNFSSPSKERVSTEDIEFIENSGGHYTFRDFFQPVFYANGNCKDNEGYVSTMFHRIYTSKYVEAVFHIEINCTVYVYDVTGNKRFLQTFARIIDQDSLKLGDASLKAEFGLDKYLKRDTLLNNPTELLPSDCLTIYVGIDFLIRSTGWNLNFVAPMFATSVQLGDKYNFFLDSEFGKKLRKVSDYFKRVSDGSMIENNLRRVHIPPAEFSAFYLISLILDQVTEIVVISIAQICDLYVVADKYCMQAIIEICRQWIKSFLLGINDPDVREDVEESIPMLLDLSETYIRDHNLKEIVEVYLKTKMDFNAKALEEAIEEDKLRTEWNCVCCKTRFSNFFKMTRTEIDCHKMEFYK